MIQHWLDASRIDFHGRLERSGNGRISILGGYYALVHLPSKRRYIGQSWRLRMRVQDHLAALERRSHRCLLMQADYNSDGRDAFDLEILGYEENPGTRKERVWMLHFARQDGGIYNSIPDRTCRQSAEALARSPRRARS